MSRRGLEYSQYENDFIRSNWQTMSDEQIGEALDRSTTSVLNRRTTMGIIRWVKKPKPLRKIAVPKTRKLFTLAEEDFIQQNWKTMTDSKMGMELGRGRSSILVHRRSMGLLRPSELEERPNVVDRPRTKETSPYFNPREINWL